MEIANFCFKQKFAMYGIIRTSFRNSDKGLLVEADEISVFES